MESFCNIACVCQGSSSSSSSSSSKRCPVRESMIVYIAN